MGDDPLTTVAKRDTAGFFSHATAFFLPLGQHFDPGSVRGYYIDMRVTADKPIRAEVRAGCTWSVLNGARLL
jgi:hypothetical protein